LRCGKGKRSKPVSLMIFTKRTFARPQIFWLAVLLTGLISAGRFPPRHIISIDVWQADDGLPQGTVNSIVQTPDGYLWLEHPKRTGPVRWRYVQSLQREQHTGHQRTNRIASIICDHEGVLWIGAEQGNLFRYQNGRFNSYEMPGRGNHFNYARVFCDDADRGLWVSFL